MVSSCYAHAVVRARQTNFQASDFCMLPQGATCADRSSRDKRGTSWHDTCVFILEWMDGWTDGRIDWYHTDVLTSV